MPLGNFDNIVGGVLYGWFWNDLDPEANKVRIEIDGAPAGVALAALFRPDLIDPPHRSGHHAFEFVIPQAWRDGRQHRFAMKADSEANDPVYCARDMVTGTETHSVDGRIDRIGEGSAYGWAYDRFDTTARLTVTAVVNGQDVGSAIADQDRPDLREVGFGDGRYGFKIPLNREIASLPHPLEITFVVEGRFPRQPLNTVTLAAPDTPPGRDPDGQASDPNALQLSQVPATALKMMRPTGLDGFFLHAKHMSDLEACEVEADETGLRVRLDQANGWARLLRTLPYIWDLRGSDWMVEADIIADRRTRCQLSLLEYDIAVFRVIHRLTGGVTLEPGPNRVEFIIRAATLRAADFDQMGRPLFMAIEMAEAFSFRLADLAIRAVPPMTDPAPYRNSGHANSVRLVQLNDAMPLETARDPRAWQLDMAEFATRNECFETASALIDRMDPEEAMRRLDPTQFLNVYAEVAFSEGRIGALRSLLLDHKALVLDDDRLFTALSYCFGFDSRFADAFAVLPSGRLNRAFLSTCEMNGAALSAILRAEAAYGDGQTDLLLANLTKPHGAEDYLHHWNRYLARFGLAPITGIDLAAGNVLASLTFSSATPPDDDNELVTVIMSAYRAGATLAYAARSILNQTHRSIELLICDDRSPDETLEVMGEVARDERVRLFQSIAGQGPYNIRNALIQEARGQYVTFQDADDVAHPERIARQLAALKQSGRPAAIARWVRLRPQGDVVFFRDQRCLRLSLVSAMARPEVFARDGGYRRVLCGADSEWYEQLRMAGGAEAYVELDMPLIFGLWSGQSLTQQSGLEVTEDGYRSATRRAYAEAATRRRLLGDTLVSSDEVDAVNRANGIYRESQGVRAIERASIGPW